MAIEPSNPVGEDDPSDVVVSAFPCRCFNCDDPADGEDGKCDLCREHPDAFLPCRFRSDDEYRELLEAQWRTNRVNRTGL